MSRSFPLASQLSLYTRTHAGFSVCSVQNDLCSRDHVRNTCSLKMLHLVWLHLQQLQRTPSFLPAVVLVSARRYCYARETESKFLWWSRHTFCLFSHVIAVLYKQLIMQFLSLLEACSGWSAMTDKARDLAALGSHSVMVLERGTSSLMGSFSCQWSHHHVGSFVIGKCVAYFLLAFSLHKYFFNLIHYEVSFARLQISQKAETFTPSHCQTCKDFGLLPHTQASDA